MRSPHHSHRINLFIFIRFSVCVCVCVWWALLSPRYSLLLDRSMDSRLVVGYSYVFLPLLFLIWKFNNFLSFPVRKVHANSTHICAFQKCYGTKRVRWNLQHTHIKKLWWNILPWCVFLFVRVLLFRNHVNLTEKTKSKTKYHKILELRASIEIGDGESLTDLTAIVAAAKN